MPRIGIFWIYKDRVFGRSSPVTTGEENYPGLFDSPNNHSEVWEEDRTLLVEFPELRGKEYFSVPRGRVLWNEAGQHAIVYMDEVLFSDRCKGLIVDFFDLDGYEVKWKRDMHYTTSPDALGAIFDDESVVR